MLLCRTESCVPAERASWISRRCCSLGDRTQCFCRCSSWVEARRCSIDYGGSFFCVKAVTRNLFRGRGCLLPSLVSLFFLSFPLSSFPFRFPLCFSRLEVSHQIQLRDMGERFQRGRESREQYLQPSDTFPWL